LRALVTGAAGFIGSRLARSLVASGHSVIGIDRFSDCYDPALKRQNVEALLSEERFDLVKADLNEVDLAPLLQGVDVVFHLAAQPGVRASWGIEFDIYLDDNVLSTQRLLEAARDARLERLVFSSSSSIYGDPERFPVTEADIPRPISPYGVTKLAAERLCHLYSVEFSVPAVVLRYFTIFGPGQRPDMAFTRFIEAALGGGSVDVYGDGLQSRDFTYVDDAVEATISAATRGTPGSTYNVAGGAPATVLEVLETLEKLLHVEIQVRHHPAAPGDARRTEADTTLARRDLGYSPKTGLREGLARQAEAHKTIAGSGER
jgi:UDP-glucuronate 4-epimerase